MLRYGYITNGLADHSLEQMVQMLRHFGYQGIGITLDHHPLDPYHTSRPRFRQVRHLLEEAGLQPVIETGARYYLDALRKHRPSMVSVDADARRRRLFYYRRAIEIAADLGARVVSLWSGIPQRGTPHEVSWRRLTEGLREVLEHAQRKDIVIGFEPEPGMFVEDLAGYEELKRRVDHPALRLTLDLGHLSITETPPLAGHVEKLADEIVNVHVDDIQGGLHQHLPLGAGDIDFPPLLAALHRVRYQGLALVELPRHSHVAPVQAQRSLIFLRNAEENRRSPRSRPSK